MDHSLTIRVDVASNEFTLSDALTRWARSIPLGLLAGLATLAGVLNAIVLGAVVVVTGRRPMALVSFQAWAVRQRVRAFSYFFLLRPDRPPVPTIDLADDGTDPRTEVTVGPCDELRRWSPFVRLIRGLPPILVGLPLGLVLDVVYPVAVVLAGTRGGWSSRYAAFLASVEEWVAHVFLYMFLATDIPPATTPRHNYRVVTPTSQAEAA